AGDPNCGKSVFSLVLNEYRNGRGHSGWRLDCDGQAPTTQWYLNWNRSAPTDAREARDRHKRDWTDAMEAATADRRRGLRVFFEVATADLPGGTHRLTPPVRIPRHREVIFREIDSLVLIERADRPTEDDWREALRPHGLDNRLVAV